MSCYILFEGMVCFFFASTPDCPSSWTCHPPVEGQQVDTTFIAIHVHSEGLDASGRDEHSSTSVLPVFSFSSPYSPDHVSSSEPPPDCTLISSTVQGGDGQEENQHFNRENKNCFGKHNAVSVHL